MPSNQRLLELALRGLEADRAQVDAEILEIKNQLNPPDEENGGTETAPKKKRKMSPEARKKISDAMKRRYAEARKVAGTSKKK